MTTPVEQIQRAVDLIRAAQHTLVCRPEDETAVRDAVTRSPYPGLFNVQVSGFLPAGTVLLFRTSLLDPPPPGTTYATTRDYARGDDMSDHVRNDRPGYYAQSSDFPAHPKPAGYPGKDEIYDALDTLDVTWDEAMASLRNVQIPPPDAP